MKVDKYDSADAGKVLIGMLTDPAVAARIAPHWQQGGLFDSQWENLVGQWAIRHFLKYNKPLGKNVVHSFAHWAEKSQDKDTHELVNKFLTQLSGRYEAEAESPNSEFVVDLARRHFNKVRATKAQEEAAALLAKGEVETAQLALAKGALPIELGIGSIIDVLEDEAAFKRAFESKAEPLIHYPGPAGIFFGDALERDGLIGVLGPSKRGKTRFLIDFAWRGMLERWKVLFLEVGDMSEPQIMRRFASRAARAPIRPPKGQGWPCSLRWPTELVHEFGSKEYELKEEMREFQQPLGWQLSIQACQKIIKKKTCTSIPLLKLACYANGSVSVAGIQSLVQSLERLGWLPDVIVIDYADLLAPLNPRADYRHQVAETWAALRALSQTTHALVITASQASSESFKTDTVAKAHFGEARQKFDFVTGMLGLSQSPAEKLDNVIRVNWLDVREMDNDPNSFLYCAGVPSISHPMLVTSL